MKQSLFDKIEAYLDNALSAEEKAEFEKALAEDQALAKELAVFELEREGRELLIEADLRKKLSQWNADENIDPHTALPPVGDSVKKKSPIWRMTLLSGLLALVSLLVWWYWPGAVPKEEQNLPAPPSVTPRQQDQQPIILQPKEKSPVAQVEQPQKKTPQQPITPESNSEQLLAMTYYERSDSSDVLRGKGSTQTTAPPLQLAKDDFRNKDFSGAATILQKILPDDPYYWQAQDLLGHTFFRMERFAEAAKVFRKITDANNNERGEMARWYLALSLLADGQSDNAKALLKNISHDAEPALQEQAKALLTELARK